MAEPAIVPAPKHDVMIAQLAGAAELLVGEDGAERQHAGQRDQVVGGERAA